MPTRQPKRPKPTTLRREWTGKPSPRWVLRFSGHKAAESPNRGAMLCALRHFEGSL